MVPSLLVIQCFIDVQESQTVLIQPITTTNQGLHDKLCIKKTETKEFTTSHYRGVISPRRSAGGTPPWVLNNSKIMVNHVYREKVRSFPLQNSI